MNKPVSAHGHHSSGDTSWHDRPSASVLAAMASRAEGLNASEISGRLEKHGSNTLPPPPRRSALVRLLSQFHNALIYFLLAAAIAAFLLGHVIDAAVILAVVIVNAAVGFVQEGKAEQALDAIRDMIAPKATVMRQAKRVSVPAAELVPGDIVLLEAGDQVPADLRLLSTRMLLIDEAILTGESVTAEKHDQPVEPDAPLGDRVGMAYSGTMVAAGQGSGVVVATGLATEIGRISELIGTVETLTTPLLAQINRFGQRFTVMAIAAAALLFAFAILFRAYLWDEALLVVVALAVGVVPEGLPAVITITLAIGVRRMAARQAIIRRLPAVETLGSTGIICSDKTGTLTRNEMTVRRIVTAQGEVLAEGAGYEPAGRLQAKDGGKPHPPALDLIRCGLLCNDADLTQIDGQWRVEGDPMEGALVSLAAKAGLEAVPEREQWTRIDTVPFDPRHRFMAALHEDPQGGRILFVKGAPERILALCDAEAAAGGEQNLDRDAWTGRIDAAAGHGERVLGFAFKRMDDAESIEVADIASLTFLGIAGFIDPPRPEAVSAVAECRSAGIAVKMITGDHAVTAAAIARQLGLADDPQVTTGADIEAVSDDDLPKLAARVDIFARTSPEHKLRLVRALQQGGDIVAMTGDGVNDAPALKQADVGVAMGMKGTEAAKQASEMVLIDDNFATIVAAVREGRTVFDNIRKVIAWTLPTNGGETLAIIIAIIVGTTIPMTPVQILWINMILTVTLGLVLAFEPAEPDVMSRPPRRKGSALLSGFIVWRIGFVSVLFVICVFGIFAWAMQRGLGLETARTMVVNTLVVLEIFYLFNVRYMHRSSFSLRGALGTPVVLVAIAVVVAAQLAFTYAPFMHALFDSRPVAVTDGLVIVVLGLALMVLLEIEKTVLRRTGLMKRLED